MPGPAYRDWLRALGAPEDPVATDTSSSWSLISLWKAIYQAISDGSFAAGIVGRAESLVSLSQAGALQSASAARVTRANKTAAAASAAAAAVSEGNASASSSAAQLAAGFAILGLRTKKDRVAAAASAASAAASAASVPTVEQSILGIHVYL